ncbi:PST family polysaccharide transporter [Microbacterium testaceum]|uniref:lipopolysaccharide biosynthesis protein n=1 Tax=Microbacterium testaceum TaxID=2033 RepID=UPI0027847E44|nr:lipopolysaccharide biosynthesis protein [Microbacterium testaceum]MDQ1175247.1 PST family polysaccharide transporter [Microbacterium testaceum]
MIPTDVTAPRRGAALLLLGAQWGRYVAQILGIVVLARLVGPADFGIVALAASVAGLAAVLGDFGLSMAALRAPTLSDAQRTNLFWMNTGIGLAATGVVLAVAQPFAAAFEDPRLVAVMCLLAPAFALRSTSAQLRVELNRSGRYGRLAASELCGDLSGLVGAVVLALLGGGYLALALQGTIAAGVTLVLSVILTPWRPGLPRRGAAMGPLLSFGGNTFLVHVLNYAATNVGTVSVARVASDQVIGLFNRATQLVNLPIDQLITPLTRVVIPGLADAEDTADLQRRLVRHQTLLCYPTLAYLSLFVATAYPALDVVLGSAWTGAAPFVPILAAGALFQILGYPQYWAFVSTGRSGLLLFSEISGRVATIALAVVVAPVGPAAVAGAIALGQFLLWGVAAVFFLPRTGVSSAALLRAAIRPIVVFAVALGAGLATSTLVFTSLPSLPRLLGVGGVWVIVVIALLLAMCRRDLRAFGGFIRRR